MDNFIIEIFKSQGLVGGLLFYLIYLLNTSIKQIEQGIKQLKFCQHCKLYNNEHDK